MSEASDSSMSTVKVASVSVSLPVISTSSSESKPLRSAIWETIAVLSVTAAAGLIARTAWMLLCRSRMARSPES
jgi:hypothetical protein